MQVTDELIRTVVQEVLAHVRKNNGPSPSSNGHSRSWGVFEQVNDAVAAAVEAQRQFVQRSLEDRRRAIQCVRTICLEQAEMLGREELEETKVGRLEHKIEKLQVVAKSIPGVEFLRHRSLQRRKWHHPDRVCSLRRHRRHHAGDPLVADPGLQCHQHAGRRQ